MLAPYNAKHKAILTRKNEQDRPYIGAINTIFIDVNPLQKANKKPLAKLLKRTVYYFFGYVTTNS